MKALYKTADIIQLSLHSLAVHAVRSVLTSLGIIFGVCGVIAMLGFTEGASYQSQLYLRELGSDKIIIRTVKPPAEAKASTAGGGANVFGLTRADRDRLTTNVPGVVRSVTLHTSKKHVRYRMKKESVSVIATGPEFLKIARVDLAEGRFLTAADILMSPRPRGPCVMAASLARRLFGHRDPIGQLVLVGSFRSEPFTVVGVLERVPQILASDAGSNESIVIIPEPVRRRRLGQVNLMVDKGQWQIEMVDISQIVLQMKDEDAVVTGAPVVRSLLKRFHDRQDFVVQIPVELLEQKKKQTRLWAIVLLVIAAISLVVGGIGIMNIMLASVTERTREIGIRRALGAKRADIAVQFLVEAVTLTTVGGLIGIGVGLLAQWGVNKMEFLPFRTIITSWALLVPFLMAVSVGLISGLYPALRAAKLDPIVALRHE